MPRKDDEPAMFSVTNLIVGNAFALMGTFDQQEIANSLRTAAQSVEDGHFDHAAKHVANSGARIRMAIEAKGWDNIRGFDLPTYELDAVLPK